MSVGGEAGTGLGEVLVVVDVLAEAGVRFWLEGGWGVDALVGRPTRRHRDIDIDVDASQEQLALEVLGRLGYQIETDWRPNRVELACAGRGWVDIHPLLLDQDGAVRQAALDGGFHVFPPDCFTSGRLGGIEVPCITAATQRVFHEGYAPRPVDVHDLELLRGLLQRP